MRIKRMVASSLAAVCGALTITVVSGSAASADTAFGCGYPQVCFYKTEADWLARKWTAAYKDVTSYYQNLSSKAYGSWAVYNSRNDDGARLHFTDGTSTCLGPNTILLTYHYKTLDKIRIMDSPTCSY